MRRLLPPIALAAALLALPPAALAAKDGAVDAVPKPTVKIEIGHLHGGKARIMSTVPVIGTVKPYVPGQGVEVSFYLNGDRIERRTVRLKKGKKRTGSFRASI